MDLDISGKALIVALSARGRKAVRAADQHGRTIETQQAGPSGTNWLTDIGLWGQHVSAFAIDPTARLLAYSTQEGYTWIPGEVEDDEWVSGSPEEYGDWLTRVYNLSTGVTTVVYRGAVPPHDLVFDRAGTRLCIFHLLTRDAYPEAAHNVADQLVAADPCEAEGLTVLTYYGDLLEDHVRAVAMLEVDEVVFGVSNGSVAVSLTDTDAPQHILIPSMERHRLPPPRKGLAGLLFGRPARKEPIRCVAISVEPDNARIATLFRDGVVILWNRSEPSDANAWVAYEQANLVRLTSRPLRLDGGMAFSANGKYLGVASGSCLHVLSVPNFSVLKTLKMRDETSAVAFHENERYVAAGGFEGAVWWDWYTGKEIISTVSISGVRTVMFSGEATCLTVGTTSTPDHVIRGEHGFFWWWGPRVFGPLSIVALSAPGLPS